MDNNKTNKYSDQMKSSSNRARLVIRNLSIKVDEMKLKNYMKMYGDIKEAIILKNNFGKNKSVAFVEYFSMKDAMKAIKKCNSKPFMGRPLAIDIAVPKALYAQKKISAMDCKSKNIKTEIKQESLDEHKTYPLDIKSPIKIEPGIKSEVNDEDLSSLKEDDDDDVKDESDEEGEEEEPPKKKVKLEATESKTSKDVMEGKTIFIKNLFYDTNENTIEDVLSQYGQLKYVLICKDKELNRSKGTAFVQFKTVKDCNSVLEAFEDPNQKSSFSIDGRQIFICKAVGRDQANTQKKANKEKREAMDKRNLFLAKEGVIREGTRPSEGVSKIDLQKRVQREVVKRKMLVNLNIFVSPIRLCIHNIPLQMNDKELMKIFTSHSCKTSQIKECRIMRDLNNVDDDGVPMSKGYGFVAFTKHDHALNALRVINNNPNIFTQKARPIVEFSLENKSAIKVKEIRLKKSVEKNLILRNQIGAIGGESGGAEGTFMGAKYSSKQKGSKKLSSHIGAKVRTEKSNKNAKGIEKVNGGKMTRNKLNHQQSKRKRNKKKQPQKKAKKTKKMKKLSK